MCDLCGEDNTAVRMAKQDRSWFAGELYALHREYKALSSGLTKPHTKEWTENRTRAQAIIRRLVEDWL